MLNTMSHKQNNYFADGIFKSIFLTKNVFFLLKLIEIEYWRSNWQIVNIGPGGGLAPYRRHKPQCLMP